VKGITLPEILTPAEIEQAEMIWQKWRPLHAPVLTSCTNPDAVADAVMHGWITLPRCAKEIERNIIEPNLERINKSLGQANVASWLALAVIWVFDNALPMAARES
jgi:hypothetical protein